MILTAIDEKPVDIGLRKGLPPAWLIVNWTHEPSLGEIFINMQPFRCL